MFVDDYIMREVRRVAALIARLADRDLIDADDDELDDELRDTYRALLGLDVGLIDSLTASTLIRMLPDPVLSEALVDLVIAHGDLLAQRGQHAAARLRWVKALELLAERGHDERLRKRLDERLGPASI